MTGAIVYGTFASGEKQKWAVESDLEDTKIYYDEDVATEID